MSRKSSDSVTAALTKADREFASRRRKTWFDGLPDELKKELLAIRRKHHAGDYTLPPYRLARVLIGICGERGVRIAAQKGVVEWLARKD